MQPAYDRMHAALHCSMPGAIGLHAKVLGVAYDRTSPARERTFLRLYLR